MWVGAVERGGVWVRAVEVACADQEGRILAAAPFARHLLYAHRFQRARAIKCRTRCRRTPRQGARLHAGVFPESWVDWRAGWPQPGRRAPSTSAALRPRRAAHADAPLRGNV